MIKEIFKKIFKVVLLLAIYIGPVGAMEISLSLQSVTQSEQKIHAPGQIPASYSVNLMWIDEILYPDEKYIIPAQDEDELNRELLTPAIKWAVANPTAEISLWYDSAYVTEAQIANTQIVLSKLLHGKELVNLSMRDVRTISIIKANQDAFSDQVPVYFRIDMFKLIIIVNSIESDKRDASIFSDLTVGDKRPNKDRMGQDELFDSDTMKKLDCFGLLHNARRSQTVIKDGVEHKVAEGNENQFLQLVNDPIMISAIKTVIINANLKRAEEALNDLDKKNLPAYMSVLFLGTLVFANTVSTVHDYYTLFAPKRQNSKDLAPTRLVDVRGGRDHFVKYSDLRSRRPADGGEIYRVQLWE